MTGRPNAPLIGIPARDGDNMIIGDLSMLGPVDLSCRGTATQPTEGAASSFDLVATDFFTGNTVEGLTISFFPDNMPAANCDAPCVSGQSDSSGIFNVTSTQDDWYAYTVTAGEGTHDGAPTDYVAATQINEPGPAEGGRATVNVVQEATVGLVTSVLVIQQQPENAVLTGNVVDCNGENIANARVRVFNGDGEITLATTGRRVPRDFYYGGTASPMPDNSVGETFVNGLYGAGNLPVTGDGTVRVEVWGVVTEGGEPEMIGCEEVGLNMGGISIVNIGPTRADGPSDCSG